MMRNFIRFLRILLSGIAIFCAYSPVFSQNLAAISRSGLATMNSPVTDKQPGVSKTLASMLDELESKYDIHFSYASDLVSDRFVNPTKKLSESDNLDELLEHLLSPLGLRYEKIEQDLYLIFQEKNKAPAKLQKKLVPDIHENNSSLHLIEKLESLGSSVLESQEKTITGKVIDENGMGLPGVNILVKGTTTGTVTDVEGNYRLNMPDDAETIVFSSIGYLSEEVTVGGQSVINVALAPDIKSLEEIVVVGYGTQKKSDLTGSVSALDADDFNKGLITSADQLIQGKAPGVQVLQNNGEPGGGISISIRGAGSINGGSAPLYVIDGLPIDNSPVFNNTGEGMPNTRSPRNPLNTINPADIESIEILKDASATAIYGARGSNGVILVTTKNGHEGSLKVSYNGSIGLQNVTKKLALLNPQEYMTTINSIINAGGGAVDERVTEVQEGGTDWQAELFQDNAIIQNHNLTFSGGNSSQNYLISLNYFDQEGLVIGSSFKRYNARVNLENEISHKFKTGINLTTTYSKDNFAPVGFDTNEGAGAVNAALYYDPTIAVRDENGEFERSPFITVDNPMALATGKDGIGFNYRTLGTIYGEYNLLPELSIRLNLGGDVNTQRRDTYIDRTTITGATNDGIATKIQGQNLNYLLEGLVNYNKNIKNQAISAVFGITTQTFRNNNFVGTAYGFPTDATKTFSLQLGDPALNRLSSNESENKLLSYLGRVNYSLQDKYLITASFRIDGSSRFGENNKFGYFPSFALGWKLHQEDFFAPLADQISTLKPRISWGQTGNQEIGNLNSLTTLGSGTQTLIGDDFVSSVEPQRIANPDLKWETTEQLNIGIDFGLWDDRINGSIDWYQKKTSDMLLNLPIPTSTGYGSILSNVGSIENTGLEISLTSNNVTGTVDWQTNFSLTTIKNEVKDLGNIQQIITGSAGFSSQIFLIEVGESLGAFYGYEIEGIWQVDDDFNQTTDPVQAGDIRYKDLNGDGAVNPTDRVILGKSIPGVIWSLTNAVSYKQFDLNVFIEAAHGVSMLNNNLADTYFPINLRRNRYGEPLLNRWTPENPSAEYPSFVTPLSQGQKSVNSYTVEDASYIRLQSISLGYNIPVNSRYLSALSVNITGQNLWVWTNYSGFDPGINPNGNVNNRIDYNAYPMARTFSLGVNVTF